MYKLWRDNGFATYFDQYHRSKLSYKHAVRAIKRNIDAIKADSLASSMMNNKYKSFWDSVKKMNARKSSLPEKIGDATGSSEILIQWRRQYESLYNIVTNSSDSVYHNTKVKHERFK